MEMRKLLDKLVFSLTSLQKAQGYTSNNTNDFPQACKHQQRGSGKSKHPPNKSY